MENAIYSRCGMRCDLCLIYRPNVALDDRRSEICRVWQKIFPGFQADPASVICDGCLCERDNAVLFDPLCKARKCVRQKKIRFCGDCEQYPCAIFPAEPTQAELIQKIDIEQQWSWEDEKLMEAYSCQKNMDAYRQGLTE